MKLKIFLCAIISFLSVNTYADGWIGPYYLTEVQVNDMGNDGDARVRIYYSTKPSGTNDGTYTSADKFDGAWGKAMLATALTAYTSGSPVKIYLKGDKFKSLWLTR